MMLSALIHTDIAPLFVKTDYESELADEVLYGMEVTIEEMQGTEWFRVRTHYGYEGFVHGRNLITDTAAVKKWRAYTKMTVSAPYIDILAEPKVQSFHLASIPLGGLVGVQDAPDSEQWQRVMLADGGIGYTKAGYLTTCPNHWRSRDENELRDALADTAMKYLGTQYRWGGKTIMGIDCSGLVSMVYMLNGVLIYRDAAIQPGYPIHEIRQESMRKGDLMFFPKHVAMYMGNDTFIHSTAYPGSEGVVINSMAAGHPRYGYRKDLMETMYAVGSVFS